MARVVKKETKQKGEINKKIPKIIASVAGGLAAVGLIVLCVFLLVENITPKLYKNSRDMDYNTLVEMLNDTEVREKYEGTIYILVFNSDIDEYPEYELSSTADSRVTSAIKSDISLNANNGKYDSQNVENANRYAFYAIDLMDDDNSSILSHAKLGSSSEECYIIELKGTSVSLTTSNVSTKLRSINDTLEGQLAIYK